jgi:hypothetical protein
MRKLLVFASLALLFYGCSPAPAGRSSLWTFTCSINKMNDDRMCGLSDGTNRFTVVIQSVSVYTKIPIHHFGMYVPDGTSIRIDSLPEMHTVGGSVVFSDDTKLTELRNGSTLYVETNGATVTTHSLNGFGTSLDSMAHRYDLMTKTDSAFTVVLPSPLATQGK